MATLSSGEKAKTHRALIWWVLGPLLIMPAMMGMPLLMFNGTTLMSLVGHLLYGALLGLGYVWYLARG